MKLELTKHITLHANGEPLLKQLMSQQGLILVHTEKLKPKGPISEKLVSSDISHIAFASVLLEENPSQEVDDYDNYYYEFIARNDSFWRATQIDFRYETKARKVMVDFKFDALYS